MLLQSSKGDINPNVLNFRKELSRLPDMERLRARVFTTSEADGRNANKVVLYEDVSKKQLQEVISALRGCETMINACSLLGGVLDSAESKLLHHLSTPELEIPDVNSLKGQLSLGGA